VPWVIDARVTARQDSTVWAEMTMGTGFLCKRFTTVALLQRPQRIEIKSQDPIFDRFEQVWTFERASGGGTNIEYRVDVQFKSGILQALIGASFAQRAKTMVDAFTRRARRLYGAAPSTSHNYARRTLRYRPKALLRRPNFHFRS
jgi:ribosome-associated toxin RatA of RatAB toxin-antitoxin module